jgi:hypothetical protein
VIKVFPDIDPRDLFAMTPLEVLEALIKRFGVLIRVGSAEGKLILEQTIPINSTGETALLEILGRPQDFVAQNCVKITEHDGARVANCALSYCLDTTRYREYLALPR